MPSKTPENTPLSTRPKAKLTPEMEAAKWKPGQSGNPGGRPKTTPITDILRKIFEEDPGTAEKALRSVLTGKSAVAKVMLTEHAADRLEGKITQPIEMEITGLAGRILKARERKSADR